jgi:hypothetical protein
VEDPISEQASKEKSSVEDPISEKGRNPLKEDPTSVNSSGGESVTTKPNSNKEKGDKPKKTHSKVDNPVTRDDDRLLPPLTGKLRFHGDDP